MKCRLSDVLEQLAVIRKERGITQKQLAEMAKITQPEINRYEMGRVCPQLETVEKIADALGCEVTVTVTKRPASGA